MRRTTAALAAALVTSLLLPGLVAAAAPIAGNDQTATPEDTAVAIDLLWNDSDPDGDLLSIDSVAQPPNGQVDISPYLRSILYTPNRDFHGRDRFSYTVADVTGETATALVDVFVASVNDAPVAYDGVATVEEEGVVEVTFRASDPDGSPCDLYFLLPETTSFGRVGPRVDDPCTADGDGARAFYMPAANFQGTDTITFSVWDGQLESDPAQIDVTVTGTDDPTVAFPVLVETPTGTPVAITLTGSDWETCDLDFRIVGWPSSGALSHAAAEPCRAGGPQDPHVDTATVVYTPSADFVGRVKMTYTAFDRFGSESDPALVEIHVVPGGPMHVGDVDGVGTRMQGGWRATATVRVETAAHAPLPWATVRGSWSDGSTVECTTGASGTCTVSTRTLARRVTTATFAVVSVSRADYVYDAGLNHDPDGDSTGTSITIARP